MSDQDFFFDEEDEKPEKPKPSEPAKKPSTPVAKASTPVAKASSAPVASSASFWQQTVTTSIAGLVAAISLLVGVIVGIVLPVGGSTNSVPTPTTGSTMDAPALSPEQLQSGQLPEGHPPLGESSAPTDTATGGGEETATP